MNISLLERYYCKILSYQFLYGFLIISILVILILELLLFKHTFSFEKNGIVLEKNTLNIALLNQEEVESVLNSKEISIENKKQNMKEIAVLEVENTYLIRLKLSEEYVNDESLKVKFRLEETLCQFIMRVVKGET